MPLISRLTDSVASSALRETLDGLSARQRAISNNIANVETPGYKRSSVSFEAELKRVLERGKSHEIIAQLKTVGPVRQTDTASPSRSDGNNVNIDAEVADLAETSLHYKAAITLMELRGSIVRAAVMEGKR